MLKKVAVLAAGRWLSKPRNRTRAKSAGQKLLGRFSSSSKSGSKPRSKQAAPRQRRAKR